MNAEGAVMVTLNGPAERQRTALEALQAKGIVADVSKYEPGKIEAWFTDGSDNPPKSFLSECEARAGAAAEGTGFTVERSGIWHLGAFSATSKWIVDIKTGDTHGVMNTKWHTPMEMEERRQSIAEGLGIPDSQLEFQDPPTYQSLTE